MIASVASQSTLPKVTSISPPSPSSSVNGWLAAKGSSREPSPSPLAAGASSAGSSSVGSSSVGSSSVGSSSVGSSSPGSSSPGSSWVEAAPPVLSPPSRVNRKIPPAMIATISARTAQPAQTMTAILVVFFFSAPAGALPPKLGPKLAEAAEGSCPYPPYPSAGDG